MNSISFFVSSGHENALWSRYGDRVLYSEISYISEPEDETLRLPELQAYTCYPSLDSQPFSSCLYYLQEGRGRWTKKVPLEWKNVHRTYWRLNPLSQEKVTPEWYVDSSDSLWVPTLENIKPFSKELNDLMALLGGKRCYWYGHRDTFKTWAFAASIETVKNQVVPLLSDDFVVKIKGW